MINGGKPCCDRRFPGPCHVHDLHTEIGQQMAAEPGAVAQDDAQISSGAEARRTQHGQNTPQGRHIGTDRAIGRIRQRREDSRATCSTTSGMSSPPAGGTQDWAPSAPRRATPARGQLDPPPMKLAAGCTGLGDQ